MICVLNKFSEVSIWPSS